MSQDMSRNGQRLSKYQLGRGDVQIWLDLDSFSKQNPGKGRGPLVPMDITHVHQGSLQRVLDGLMAFFNGPVSGSVVGRCKVYFNVECLHNIFIKISHKRIAVITDGQMRDPIPAGPLQEGPAALLGGCLPLGRPPATWRSYRTP